MNPNLMMEVSRAWCPDCDNEMRRRANIFLCVACVRTYEIQAHVVDEDTEPADGSLIGAFVERIKRKIAPD